MLLKYKLKECLPSQVPPESIIGFPIFVLKSFSLRDELRRIFLVVKIEALTIFDIIKSPLLSAITLTSSVVYPAIKY